MEQKKERTKLGNRFFLLSASSIEKMDALKPHYYDKKKFPVLQDNSYKKTSVQLFNEYIQSYSWKNETCPWCGSNASCVFHDTYKRSMTDFVHGKTIYGEACVIRLRCTSCGHTHAILPDVIIP